MSGELRGSGELHWDASSEGEVIVGSQRNQRHFHLAEFAAPVQRRQHDMQVRVAAGNDQPASASQVQ